jgi:transposase
VGARERVVADAPGLPLRMAAAGADACEQKLPPGALKDVPLEVPEGTPVIADQGHDADALREKVEADGLVPVIPHRQNHSRPSRNDGRRLRHYAPRWLIERTNAWLPCYRGLAVRWSYYSFLYTGLVYLSFIHLALQGFETVSTCSA